jgi:hypothetical protein
MAYLFILGSNTRLLIPRRAFCTRRSSTRFRPIDDHKPLLAFVCALLLTTHICLVSSRLVSSTCSLAFRTRTYTPRLLTTTSYLTIQMRRVCGTWVCTRPHAAFIQSSYNPYTSIRRGNTGLHQWNEQTIIILPSLHISLFASRYISHTLIPTHHPRHSIMYCDTERSRLSRLIPSPSRSIDHARNAYETINLHCL